MYIAKDKNYSKKKHLIIFGGSSPIGLDLINNALKKNFIVTSIGRKKITINSKNFFFKKVDLSLNNLNFKKIFKQLNRIKITHIVFLQRSRSKKESLDNEVKISVKPIIKIINEFYKENQKNKMKKSILITSSPVVGKSTTEQEIGYHLGKAMIDQIVRYYSVYLGKINCNINALSPDLILKKRTYYFFKKNKKLSKFIENVTPLKRMATTDEIAKIILNFISDELHYFNGQIFRLDGGIGSYNHLSLATMADKKNFSLLLNKKFKE